jgi:leucyl aminopeptidase
MFVLAFLALSASISSALSVPKLQQVALSEQDAVAPERYLIETNPGETQWVTEDEKWTLRRVRPSFEEPPRLSQPRLTLCRMA